MAFFTIILMFCAITIILMFCAITIIMKPGSTKCTLIPTSANYAAISARTSTDTSFSKRSMSRSI
ncbi:hypothetical protein FRX31_030060, partial [Thalictrum thalictroides]